MMAGSLARPTLSSPPPAPFESSPSGKDTYWAFALPVNMGRDSLINGIEFRPGNRRVVHHSRIYLDTTGDARRRDLADPGQDFWDISGLAEPPSFPIRA